MTLRHTRKALALLNIGSRALADASPSDDSW